MSRWQRAAGIPLLAVVLTLTACDGGLLSFDSGDGAPVNAQVAHMNGAVLNVLSVKRAGERSVVMIRIMNGRDGDIQLRSGDESTYLVTDSGEKLMLVPSLTNSRLTVPAGKVMDGELVFAGSLPSSGQATMVINANGSADSRFASDPRFEVTVSLDGAGASTIPEKSGLSHMLPVPVSRFGPAAASTSSLSAGASGTSSLSAVDRLKTELGAVETDRGTVVSLPGDVTFDFAKASIRTDAQATLDSLAQLITAGGAGEITIEGHTDAKGDDAYNKKLSQQRADAVKTYLTGKGVDAARLRTIGLGELRPVGPNAKPDGSDDEEGRQRNRRVEVILPKTAAATAPSSAAPASP